MSQCGVAIAWACRVRVRVRCINVYRCGMHHSLSSIVLMAGDDTVTRLGRAYAQELVQSTLGLEEVSR